MEHSNTGYNAHSCDTGFPTFVIFELQFYTKTLGSELFTPLITLHDSDLLMGLMIATRNLRIFSQLRFQSKF